MCIGVNAALISIITAWLSDLKMGYCSDGWWLNRQFCCWEIEGGDEGCDSWHSWSTAVAVRWTIYVLFAVRLHVTRSKESYSSRLHSGHVLLHSGPSCEIYSEVCGRVRYIRDQVYSGWLCHERIPWFRDVLHQEHDASVYFFYTTITFIFMGIAFSDCVRAVSREGGTFSACCMLYRQSGCESLQAILT